MTAREMVTQTGGFCCVQGEAEALMNVYRVRTLAWLSVCIPHVSLPVVQFGEFNEEAVGSLHVITDCSVDQIWFGSQS